jgi:hypothetical protein
MIDRFFSVVLPLALLALSACLVRAADSAVTQEQEQSAPHHLVAPPSLVVLRNGEVLAGKISRDGERYLVSAEGTEIRLSPREVDFVCQTLDEAYNVQHNRVVAGRIEDRLSLADWCLRHQLLGYAAREITAAMQIDSKNPRVMLLDARLRRALVPEPAKAAETNTAATRPISADELERLVRSLPPSTVEAFTSTVQPMLLNYCATAGCHGPNSSSSFTLSRAPLEKIAARRLTERNLYNTLQWIDRDNPVDSKLLTSAREPHGPNQASGATGVGTAKYQELMNWVLQASINSASNSASVAGGTSSAPRAALPAGAAPVLASPGLTSPAPATLLMPSSPAAPAGKGNNSRLRKSIGAAAANLTTSAATAPIEQAQPVQRAGDQK